MESLNLRRRNGAEERRGHMLPGGAIEQHSCSFTSPLGLLAVWAGFFLLIIVYFPQHMCVWFELWLENPITET